MILGDGSVERERAGAASIPLPAEGDDGEAVAQKPGVAGVCGEILVAAIDERQNMRKTAIRTFEKKRAVAFGGVFGADGDEIGGEFNFAVLETDCFFEVNDGFVVGVVYGDGEKDFAGEAFVRASVAEGLSIENVHARDDFDASNSSDEGWNCEEEQEGSENRAASEASNGKFHARQNSTE